MRAAIYARVSSAAQRDSHTIESQLRVLKAFVAGQGWTLVDTYIDDGRSAKTGLLERRDGFGRLMRDAEASRFEVLAVVDVDRMTRTGSIEERAEILGPFQRQGIAIATPAGGVMDLRSFLGEFYVTLQALVGAEENRKRAERIKAGKLRAIAEGRKPAGPTPYGHTYSRAAGEWGIDKTRAQVLREIFRRVIAGESCLAIADDLFARAMPSPKGPWTRHKVWALVRSRHAAGEWTADKRRRLTIRVPAIVDEATWQAAQAKLIEHGKRGLVKTKHVYLLERLAVCAACGSPISIRSAASNPQRANGNPSPAAYVCRARKLSHRSQLRCTAPIVKVAEADARVWAKVSAALAGPELAASIRELAAAQAADRRDWVADAKKYRAHLARLVKTEAAILARFQRGAVSPEALDVSLAAHRREASMVKAQLEAAERAAEAPGLPQAAPDEWIAELRGLARSASPEERQRVVRAIVKPGSALLERGRVRLTLLIGAPGSRALPADGAPAQTAVLAVVPGYRSQPGKIGPETITVRVVA